MFRRGFAGRRPGGLLGAAARTAVVAGTASAVVGGMRSRRDNRAEEQALAEQQRADQAAAQQRAYAQHAAQQQSYAQQPAAPRPDLVSRIGELAKLREAGALTDAEFAAAKATLLGGG